MRSLDGWRGVALGVGFPVLTIFVMGQGCPNASTLTDLANSVLSSTNTDTSANTSTSTSTTTSTSGNSTSVQTSDDNGNAGSQGGPGSILVKTFTAAPFTATFDPGQTGETLDVVVAGNNKGSRLTVTVTDPSGATVASVTSPTSNISSASFAPGVTGTFTISATEGGTASTLYIVDVFQPRHGMPDMGQHVHGHGLLLNQTFTTSPMTATFTPAQTGQLVDVAVFGNDAASRVTLTVTDPSGVTVASVSSPSTNLSTARFTPETAGIYTLTATETGTSATLYVVHVLQPIRDGAELADARGTLLYRTFASAPITATITPINTGQNVTVVVAGNDAASRLTFTVTDPSAATVASVTSPTTDASLVTFTPETAGAYTVSAMETGSAAGVYVIEATQPLSAGLEVLHEGRRGALLWQTSSSAPITATFSPKQAGESIDVVVAGKNADSRLTFTVTDPSGATVAGVTTPSANASSVVFTAAVTGTYNLVANETGTAGTWYAVRVTELKEPEPTFDDGATPSALLYEPFGSSPITTTFSVATVGKPVVVAVGGENAASLLTLNVTDASAAVVASVTTPSTNVSSVTFTPAAAGTFTVTATETGTPSTAYAAEVVEPMGHHHP